MQRANTTMQAFSAALSQHPPQQSVVELQRGIDSSCRPVRQQVSGSLKAHGGGWSPCSKGMWLSATALTTLLCSSKFQLRMASVTARQQLAERACGRPASDEHEEAAKKRQLCCENSQFASRQHASSLSKALQRLVRNGCPASCVYQQNHQSVDAAG